jgi:hypothetical protein
MALNRRLCFTAQEPWVIVAYEMIFLIFILLSREIWRHSLSLQVFCQTESALKAERTRQYASISGRCLPGFRFRHYPSSRLFRNAQLQGMRNPEE